MGRGPPLVLLHGWAMHSGLWAPLLPRLAERYRVHPVDLPGHGHSAPVAPYTLDAVAAAVRPRSKLRLNPSAASGRPRLVARRRGRAALGAREARARRRAGPGRRRRRASSRGPIGRTRWTPKRCGASATSWLSRIEAHAAALPDAAGAGQRARARRRWASCARISSRAASLAQTTLADALELLAATDLRAEVRAIRAARAGHRRRARHAGAARRGTLARRRAARCALPADRRRRRTRRSCRIPTRSSRR